MIDDYLLEKIDFYIKFLEKNTISASQRIHKINNAIECFNNEVKNKDDYVDAYKCFVHIKDIIHEMCDNYLVDEHTQDVLKDKMNLLSRTLIQKRDGLSSQKDKPEE